MRSVSFIYLLKDCVKASFAPHGVFPFAQIAFSEGNKKLLAIVNVKNSCKISLLISFSFCHNTWREQTKQTKPRGRGRCVFKTTTTNYARHLKLLVEKHTQHWSRGNPRLPQGGACAVTQCVSVGYLDTLPPIRLAPPPNRTKRSQDGCQKYEYMMPPWRHQLAHTFAYVRARRRWRAERNVFSVVKVMQHTLGKYVWVCVCVCVCRWQPFCARQRKLRRQPKRMLLLIARQIVSECSCFLATPTTAFSQLLLPATVSQVVPSRSVRCRVLKVCQCKWTRLTCVSS